MVYEKYPRSEGEKNCRVERETMNTLREVYKKKLISEQDKEI